MACSVGIWLVLGFCWRGGAYEELRYVGGQGVQGEGEQTDSGMLNDRYEATVYNSTVKKP